MIAEVLAGAFGALAFARLFGTPRKYLLCCGFCGGIGWLAYSLCATYGGLGNTMATFCASMVMALFTRFLSVMESCPATVFLTAGTIPLVPGARVFWMSYYLVTGDNAAGISNGAAALKAAAAIVLANVLIFQLPGVLFRWAAVLRPNGREEPADTAGSYGNYRNMKR